MKDRDLPITRAQAVERAAEHVGTRAANGVRDAGIDNVSDGWPEGTYRASDEPVWAVNVFDDQWRVGGTRVLCISKATGLIVFDGHIGE